MNLESTQTQLGKVLPENVKISLDIHGHCKGISMVPVDITVTNQKPDMVIIDNLGNVTIVELTVPFESNILVIHAEQRKKNRDTKPC